MSKALKYVNVTFIIEVPVELNLVSGSLEYTTLFETDSIKYVLVGGNAKEWRDTILDECNPKAKNEEINELFFLCFQYLRKTKLKMAFEGYKVKGNKVYAG